MEFKLNKVDMEIRQDIKNQTIERKINRKEKNIVSEEDDNHRKFKKEEFKEFKAKKKIVINGEQCIEDLSSEPHKGLLIDKKL